jgi:uncharacterized protein (TIGR02271 family)
LDFQRGTPVVAPEGEVGRLAHVVVDRASGAASDVVVDRGPADGRNDSGRWVVPIKAVITADGDRVLLQDTWYATNPVHFDPAAFDVAPGSLVIHRGAHRAAAHAAPLSDRIELREERLVAETFPVEAGAVQLRTEVVPQARTIDVPVEREIVVVEHRPVEGASPAPGPVGERVIEVVVHAERVIVDTVPIVREEVALGKRVVPDVERVSATTRKERAVVEAEGDVDVNEKTVLIERVTKADDRA